MKKKNLFALFGIVAVFALAACNNNDNSNPGGDDPEEVVNYTVTFNTNGGSSVDSVQVEEGKKVSKPADPTKSYYEFVGWYTGLESTVKFDFDAAITEDVTVYARWNIIDVMSYEDFMDAEAGDEVCIKGIISAKQSWWDNKVTMYLATENPGEGYFLYEFQCTQEENDTDYAIGNTLVVYGEKSIYAEEHEIAGSDIDYELTQISNETLREAIIDVTSSVDSEDLFAYQNSKFTATLAVKEYTTTDTNANVAENGAYGYKGDAPTDDLYFTLVDANGNELACCVEKYLTSAYETVKAAIMSEDFTVGTLVKVEGYMYWWNGANPHITSIEFGQEDAVYETFMSTEDGEEVEVYGFLISKTTYWNGTNLYLAGSQAGEGYYVYEYACSQEVFDTLVVNLNDPIYVKVNGTKASYAGMQEIIDATVTIVETEKTMNGLEIENIGEINENLMSSAFVGEFEVVSFTTTDNNVTIAENGAYGYKGDEPTDDLYFNVKDENGNILRCCVETYVDYEAIGGVTYKPLLYTNVQELSVGDKVRIQGFMYWWYGANPHIVSVEVIED